MKKLVVLAFVLWFFSVGLSSQVALEEVYEPYKMKVHGNYIFISDDKDGIIKCFDLKTGKLLKKIGTPGEGPGEFKGAPKFKIIDDKIEALSNDRVLWFDFNGTLIKERKVQTAVLDLVNDSYLVSRFIKDEEGGTWMKVMISNSSFEDIALLDKRKLSNPNRRINFYWLVWNMRTHNNSVIVCDSNKFLVRSYDDKGKLKWEINRKNYERREFSSDVIEELKVYMKKTQQDRYLKRVIFPEYFPAIYKLKTDGNRIYLITNREKNSKNECFIYGVDGKLIKHIWIPLYKLKAGNYSYASGFEIHKGVLYKLVENEETENWDLHSYRID